MVAEPLKVCERLRLCYKAGNTGFRVLQAVLGIMAELSASEPLLSKRTEEPGCFKRSHLPVSLGKWVLKILMWVIFIAWVGMIFLYPSDFVNSWFWKLVGATQGSIFGITGSIFLIFSAPVLVISFLAYAYVAAHSEEHYQKKIQKFPRFRLWTFPVLVDGPFGVVSAAEFIGIILFIAYVIWAVFAYAIQMESQISEFPIPSKQKRYENLILVAGGIGISPFLAVLSDILHRIEEKRPCLPRNILVIWAVKKSKELSLLSVVDSQHFCTSFSDKLNLDIQSYVTQESEPSLEEGKIYRDMIQSSLTMTNGSQMSNLVGTGNNLWAWAYFLAATTSFVISFGLLEMFYIRPHGISSWWYRGLLFIICMVASVIIFGGLIVFFWHHMERGNSSYEKCRDSDNSLDFLEYNKPVVHDELTATNLMSLMTTHYGCRPDIQDLFNSFSERVGHVDVGVLVCGPPGLQTSVAKVCRRQNIRGRWNQPIFHFNSHSFDL